MAGTHFPEKGWQVRAGWCGVGGCLHAMSPSFPPPPPPREQEGGSCCCFLSPQAQPPPSWAGHGGRAVLSQVECFETKVKTTKPCESLQKPTKEPENRSCRRNSTIPNFVLGRENRKGKEGESRVSMQCEEVGFSLTTQLSGYFYGGKILT